MNREEFAAYVEERNEAVLSGDFEKFKQFYRKYKSNPELGLFDVEDDDFLMIIWNKMIIGSSKATVKQKLNARMWLRKKGWK